MTRTKFFTLLIACSLLLGACTSRYRLDLFMLRGEERDKIKVEKTQYINSGVLADLNSLQKVTTGPGNCIVLIVGGRGRTFDAEPTEFIQYDDYLRYKIYIQLPKDPTPDTINLDNAAFVQMLGRYDVPLEDKMFAPREGTLVIDSIPGKHLFGTIDARFANPKDATVAFQGQFKIKIAD